MITTPTTAAPHDLLAAAYAWTSEQLAAADRQPGAPTPCGDWTVAELADHLVEAARRLTDAAAPEPHAWTGGDRRAAFAEIAERSPGVWQAAEPTAILELPFGAAPAALVSWVHLNEIVVHGWDLGRAAGRHVDIPAELAAPVIEPMRQLLALKGRDPAFAAALDESATASPSHQLLALLGRDPNWRGETPPR